MRPLSPNVTQPSPINDLRYLCSRVLRNNNHNNLMETKIEPKKKYILVYGTLRKHAAKNWNFNRFGPQKILGSEWIGGYTLHSLGGYPAVCIGVGSVLCELHEVYEKTYDAITRMEKGAGYEVHEVDATHPAHGKVKASLYAMPWGHLATITKGRIASGDWNVLPMLPEPKA